MNTSENPNTGDHVRNQDSLIPQPSKEAVYDSESLFGTRTEITICHNGECYRLRKTKAGKLILNK